MKSNLKDRILQDAQIVLFGLLTLALILLLILELIPNASFGLEVAEVVKVSSSSLSPMDAEVKDYHTSVTGILSNPTDGAVAVDSLTVEISDGKTVQTVTVAGFEIPARSTHEFSYEFEGQTAFDRVNEVKVTRGGASDVIPNTTGTSLPVSGVAVFYAVLLIPAVLLTVRAAKGRYYLYQESAQNG